MYNAKIYAQYYGDKDNITVLGGGNNVNSNQLTVGASGMSDIASVGANYNTSRIKGMDTDVAASYDFRPEVLISMVVSFTIIKSRLRTPNH